MTKYLSKEGLQTLVNKISNKYSTKNVIDLGTTTPTDLIGGAFFDITTEQQSNIITGFESGNPITLKVTVNSNPLYLNVITGYKEEGLLFLIAGCLASSNFQPDNESTTVFYGINVESNTVVIATATKMISESDLEKVLNKLTVNGQHFNSRDNYAVTLDIDDVDPNEKVPRCSSTFNLYANDFSSTGIFGPDRTIHYHNAPNFTLLIDDIVTTEDYPNNKIVILNLGNQTNFTAWDVDSKDSNGERATLLMGEKGFSYIVPEEITVKNVKYLPKTTFITGRDATLYPTTANKILIDASSVSTLLQTPEGSVTITINSETQTELQKSYVTEATIRMPKFASGMYVKVYKKTSTVFVGSYNINGYLHSITLDVSAKTLTIVANSDWRKITNKPTSISGYGIQDAYISGNTIKLGTNELEVPGEDIATANYTGNNLLTGGFYISALSLAALRNLINDKLALITVTIDGTAIKFMLSNVSNATNNIKAVNLQDMTLWNVSSYGTLGIQFRQHNDKNFIIGSLIIPAYEGSYTDSALNEPFKFIFPEDGIYTWNECKSSGWTLTGTSNNFTLTLGDDTSVAPNMNRSRICNFPIVTLAPVYNASFPGNGEELPYQNNYPSCYYDKSTRKLKLIGGVTMQGGYIIQLYYDK